LQKGAFMEQLEEVFSSSPFSEKQVQQAVEELENETFNRGLPEKGAFVEQANEHGLSNADQRDAANSEHHASVKISPLILLVDDEEPFRRVIKQVLSIAGYDVVEAANGVEAVHQFYEKPADMIITDIIMPEKEGLETIIELKKAHPEVKLIAMSGGGWYGTDIDFDMAKKLGARTLDKPFELQELLDVVGELLD
jgi:CheY-like chemotaxis protein